mmetsp:Transcript_28581/g.47300  ORF Transcript_28581/g.47300 Transcript_28581/m.47300 type:complete len:156 (+) Transcript_28581:135-602(+)
MLSSTLRTASRVASTSLLNRPTNLAAATAINNNNSFAVFDSALQQHQQVRHRSNRSRRGMYDGKDIRSGNNVSFSERKTRRKFKPNVVIKRVYSEVLDEMIRFHLTAATLRTIDKVGGLDNYLLKSKHVTEGEGLKVKNRILERMEELEGEVVVA